MIQQFNIYKTKEKRTDKSPDYRLQARDDEKAFNIGVGWRKKSDYGDYLSIVLDKTRTYEKDGETIRVDGFVIIKESEYNSLLSNQKQTAGNTDVEYPDEIDPEQIPF